MTRTSRAAGWVLALAVAAAALGSGGASARAPRDAAKAPGSELVLERTVRIGNLDVFRYRQEVDGLEVLDAGAVVKRVHGAATASAASDTTAATIRRPGKPSVGRQRAIAIATDAVDITESYAKTTARLAISKRRGGTLVWLVQIPSLQPLGDFEVLVGARSGRVLSTTDVMRRADGTGAVYDPNPIVEQGDYVGLRDNRNRNSARLTALRRVVTLPHLYSSKRCLVGSFVDARMGKRKKLACAPNYNFTGVTRRSKKFEAVMAYFHIDRMQTYIQSLQLGQPINQRRQLIITNAFRDDNAFYSYFNKRILLGSGGVDDGEDGDVIIHEYGHAIQDNQIPGFGKSLHAAAMGEGFGDYLAAVNTVELSQAAPTAENVACIFDWDSTAYSPPCGRRADVPWALSNLSPQCKRLIHCLGMVWSSALLDLRYLLGDDIDGRSIMDSVVFAHHFLLGKSATLAQAGQALIDAADALYPGDPSIGDAIDAEMIDRGILTI